MRAAITSPAETHQRAGIAWAKVGHHVPRGATNVSRTVTMLPKPPTRPRKAVRQDESQAPVVRQRVTRPTVWLDLHRWQVDALAVAWRTATPFAHVVIDHALGPSRCAALCRAADREPHRRQWGELYEFHASPTPPTTAELRALLDDLASPTTLAAVGAITGRPVGSVEAQSYRYDAGCYALPHTDDGRGRCISFALYLAAAVRGGELDLYACNMEDGAVAHARVATTIATRAGRLVLFDVAPRSLHRVREVTAGCRMSVAGWFLA